MSADLTQRDFADCIAEEFRRQLPQATVLTQDGFPGPHTYIYTSDYRPSFFVYYLDNVMLEIRQHKHDKAKPITRTWAHTDPQWLAEVIEIITVYWGLTNKGNYFGR
jgi:hypothetical protein